jgi:hypothetical protein
MSIHTVEIALPTGIDSVSVGLAEPISIVEVRQGPVGPGSTNSVTSATTSDGTADLDLLNVDTVTATVSGTLTADHIHGNLAGNVYAHVRAGETLTKGDPVYVSGSHGSGSTLIPIVSKAAANNAAKMPAIGMMDADLANNANGHMVIVGTITELNTAGLTVNAELYVAAGGGLTGTPPTARAQPVARVERVNANNGAVIVKVNGLSASDATANTLVRRTSTGGVSLGQIFLSGSIAPAASGQYDIGLDDTPVKGVYCQTMTVANAVSFGATTYTYGAGAASAHRIALGAGTTGAELFGAADAAAARTTLGLSLPLAVASGGTGTTNGSITGTGALTLASAAASNINLTPGTTGFIDIAKASQTGVRESLLRATVSDSSGTDGFFVSNGTGADSRFAPAFGGVCNSTSTSWAIQLAGFVSAANDASDSSNFGLIDIVALRSTSSTDPFNGTLSDVANRKLLTVRSATGTKVEVAASGAMKLNATTASTSTTTGALIVSGGVGIAGAVNVGGNITGSGALTLASAAASNINLTPGTTGIVTVGANSAALLGTVATNGIAVSLPVTSSGAICFSAENRAASSSGGGPFAALYSNDGAALASGDRLGGFILGGSSSASSLRGAVLIAGFAEAAWVDGSNYGAGISFETTANGGTTRSEKMRLSNGGNLTVTGNVGIGTTSPTALLDVNSDTVRIRTARTPASAAAAGNAGDICWDADYIYVCTATNTWKRTAISTWP